MKSLKAILLVLVSILAFASWNLLSIKSTAAGTTIFQKEEYSTIRWGGRENTHIIRPNGKVEFLTGILSKMRHPDRSDERSYFMNIAMNVLAKEGYVFAGMTHDEIVMKRAVEQ